MSLVDRLGERDRGHKCVVGRMLDALPDADRKVLLAALDDIRFTGTEIHRAVIAEGFRMSYMTLLRHRRGECFCNGSSWRGAKPDGS